MTTVHSTTRPSFLTGLLGLTVATLLGMGSCGGGGAPTEETPEDPGALRPVNVSVVTLEPTELDEEITLTGRVEPWVEVTVATELGGTVSEVGFDKGQSVRKGHVIARIGSDLRTVQLEEAEAELLGAEADFKKTSELMDRQAVPRQDLIAATSRYQMARARVRQARLLLERSILKAPITGVAVTRDIEPGEVVAPGARVTTLHQVSRLKVEFGIPEDDITFFSVGDPSSIAVDAFPGRSFEGRIHFIGPAATGKNRTFPAEIELHRPDGPLRPGMIARVSLVKRRYRDALVVFRDALVERSGGSVAYVLEDGRARRRTVELGPSEGPRVVVLEGLEAGERLIVTGHRNLVDGHPVNVVREE